MPASVKKFPRKCPAKRFFSLLTSDLHVARHWSWGLAHSPQRQPHQLSRSLVLLPSEHLRKGERGSGGERLARRTKLCEGGELALGVSLFEALLKKPTPTLEANSRVALPRSGSRAQSALEMPGNPPGIWVGACHSTRQCTSLVARWFSVFLSIEIKQLVIFDLKSQILIPRTL